MGVYNQKIDERETREESGWPGALITLVRKNINTVYGGPPNYRLMELLEIDRTIVKKLGYTACWSRSYHPPEFECTRKKTNIVLYEQNVMNNLDTGRKALIDRLRKIYAYPDAEENREQIKFIRSGAKILHFKFSRDFCVFKVSIDGRIQCKIPYDEFGYGMVVPNMADSEIQIDPGEDPD